MPSMYILKATYSPYSLCQERIVDRVVAHLARATTGRSSIVDLDILIAPPARVAMCRVVFSCRGGRAALLACMCEAHGGAPSYPRCGHAVAPEDCGSFRVDVVCVIVNLNATCRSDRFPEWNSSVLFVDSLPRSEGAPPLIDTSDYPERRANPPEPPQSAN